MEETLSAMDETVSAESKWKKNPLYVQLIMD